MKRKIALIAGVGIGAAMALAIKSAEESQSDALDRKPVKLPEIRPQDFGYGEPSMGRRYRRPKPKRIMKGRP